MDSLKQLLDEAKTAGLMVSVHGDRLIIRGPKSAENLAKLILAEKNKVIQHLSATIDMTLEQFSETDVTIGIYSEVLGQIVWFISGGKITQMLQPGEIFFRADELKSIIQWNPVAGELKKIVMVKEIFPSSKIVEFKQSNLVNTELSKWGRRIKSRKMYREPFTELTKLVARDIFVNILNTF